jgi:hypothetical protein
MSILNIHATAHLSPRIPSYDSSSLTNLRLRHQCVALSRTFLAGNSAVARPSLRAVGNQFPIMSAEAYSRLCKALGEILCRQHPVEILLKVESCVISQEHLLVVILPKRRSCPYFLWGR